MWAEEGAGVAAIAKIGEYRKIHAITRFRFCLGNRRGGIANRVPKHRAVKQSGFLLDERIRQRLLCFVERHVPEELQEVSPTHAGVLGNIGGAVFEDLYFLGK